MPRRRARRRARARRARPSHRDERGQHDRDRRDYERDLFYYGGHDGATSSTRGLYERGLVDHGRLFLDDGRLITSAASTTAASTTAERGDATGLDDRRLDDRGVDHRGLDGRGRDDDRGLDRRRREPTTGASTGAAASTTTGASTAAAVTTSASSTVGEATTSVAASTVAASTTAASATTTSAAAALTTVVAAEIAATVAASTTGASTTVGGDSRRDCGCRSRRDDGRCRCDHCALYGCCSRRRHDRRFDDERREHDGRGQHDRRRGCRHDRGDDLAAPAAADVRELGTASQFSVLAATSVANDALSATVITGNVGVAPGTVVTGFPLGIVLLGAIHADDALADSAHTDAIAAYTALVAETCDFDLSGTDLGGLLLTPGKYCFSGDATLTGILT